MKKTDKKADKKEDKPKFDLNTEVGRLKMEIAEELGLREKIEKSGWKSLTSRESGAMGGKISGIRRRKKDDDKEKAENAEK